MMIKPVASWVAKKCHIIVVGIHLKMNFIYEKQSALVWV